MPIFSHSSFVQRAICWGLLIALILTGFLIPVLSLVTASRNGADLRARVLQAAATLDRKVAYVDGALLRLSSWEGHCGTELFRERRRELTMNPGVIDFLFLMPSSVCYVPANMNQRRLLSVICLSSMGLAICLRLPRY